MNSAKDNSPVHQAGNFANESDVVKLADLVSAHTPNDGVFKLCIPGVYAVRRSRISAESTHDTVRPALCIVAQGEKRIMLGQEVYYYNPSHMLIFSVDLPVTGDVTRASLAEPFLGFVLTLDLQKITELVLRVYPRGLPRSVRESRGVHVCQIDMKIVNAAVRLLELAAQPEDAELLAPLLIEEILIRLLRSPIGIHVAQIGFAESSAHGIAKAIGWLRTNFPKPVRVERLAELAHMSVSSFHQHFKSVTSMSPLQYQKVMRLQEARRLMLSTMMDVSTASYRVGYKSASQFSREYARFFGSSPNRDIARLKEQSIEAEDA